ncbi:RadC family protein [Celeribacter marinus]|uniref:RadC family protein n=1 Tax=Celeribacter marinus TaxID=1397108 RepID=UPI00316BD242
MSKIPASHDFPQMPQWLFDLDDARPVQMPARLPSILRNHRHDLHNRLMSGGGAALQDSDLLDLVVGRALPRADVRSLVERLLHTFGDYSTTISAPVARLLQIDGMTLEAAQELKLIEASAHRLARARVLTLPILSSWNAVVDYCHTVLSHCGIERLHVLYLDRKNRLIVDEVAAQGTVDHVPVYPREIIKRALELNASTLILVHNHPSGDPTPSDSDIAMTTQIRDAAATMDINLHDHLIIGKAAEFSFRGHGLL